MQLPLRVLISIVIVVIGMNQITGQPHMQLYKTDKQITRPKIRSIVVQDQFKELVNFSIKHIRSIGLEINAFDNDFTIDLHQSATNRCSFIGSVNESRAMPAQFNLCHGLKGEFQWNNHIYFLKPTRLYKLFLDFSSPGTQLLPHHIYFDTINQRRPLFSCQLIKDDQVHKDIPKTAKLSSTFPRLKRSVHSDYPVIDSDIVEEHKIELLIVVTNNFIKRFKKDLKQYILNNVAIATKLLRHPTINASISIDIVDIIPLDEDYEKKSKLHNWSLLSQDNVVVEFCQWLKEKKNYWNYSWDSAILINDGYFSSNAIGIAHLQSMCNDNNCLAVVDRGFGTGFIIAHELAHQMDARHDFDNVEACKKYEVRSMKYDREIIYNTMMSTSLYFDNYPFVWSKCSQYLINTFLKSKRSSCLKEQNKIPNLYSHENIIKHLQRFSTGVEYDLDQQCSFAFGEPAEFCISENSKPKKCSTLYCRLRRHHLCVKADALIADGTECDTDKHCVHGECIPKTMNTDPIDGGWSDYSSWSNCSRSCDGGVQFSHRFCNNPVPSLGGRFCVGTKERIRSCNVEQCPKSVDPREESCKKHNMKPYIPQNDEEFPCNLVCIANNNSIQRDISLTDGTPCSSLRSDICVKGTCYKTGCDRVVGSRKVFDHCHRCGGINNTCTKKEGFFDGSTSKGKMMVAFTVPPNVTNLFIEKVSERSTPYTTEVYDDFELLLVIEKTTVIRRSATVEPLAGGQLFYSGANMKVETIEIKGKIAKEIVVIVKQENQDSQLNLPSIHYHYYIPKDVFVWKHQEIHGQSCRDLCNGYIEISLACFRENDNRRVVDHRCSDIPKPEPIIKSCSSLCGYRWQKPSEDYVRDEMKISCPISCGIDKLKVNFLCQENISTGNDSWKTINDSRCISVIATDRPYLEVNCDGKCIPPKWSYGNWEKCPIECGTGSKHRSSICIDHKGTFHNMEFCLDQLGPPDDKQPCLSLTNCQNLTKWVASSWSKCSKTCGNGIQTRIVYCLRIPKTVKIKDIVDEQFLKENQPMSDAYCEVHSVKPSIERQCKLDNCFQWVLKDGGQCSVTCGNGSRIQYYVCRKKPDQDPLQLPIEDQICLTNNLPRPKSIVKICFNKECPVESFWVETNWNKCSVSCGEGVRQRVVQCGYKNQNNTITLWPNNDRCENITMPITVQKCKVDPCPNWIYGEWSECEGTCLYGMQHRFVICSAPNSDNVLPNSHCNATPKYESTKICLISKLCGYWKVGRWSKCSVPCGLGVKSRSVSCHHINGTKSSDNSICSSIVPFDEIHCQTKPCKSKSFWWLMRTSECYGFRCNPGIMYANVRCVNHNFDVKPDGMCRPLKHPNYYAGCVSKQCQQYIWVAHSWDNNECPTNSCVVTMLNRKVECVDDYGHIYKDSYCDESTKPDTWRLCLPKKCSDVPLSCSELKRRYPDSTDGEYSLSIDLNWTNFIYCADMNTDDPKEYLTLRELNYARSSKFVSQENHACIYDEEVENNRSCPDCKVDDSLRSITYYDKIRINLTDLTVDVLDNRFSMTNGPLYMPYATAKDCGGSTNCPRGHFKIDLRGTGFSVSMKTAWNELYPKHGYRIVRTQSSQIVKGWCGGNCLGCSPLDRLYIEPQMYGRDFEVKSKEIF